MAALPRRLRDGHRRPERLAAAAIHYLYGGIRLQTPGERTTRRRAQVQLSVLLGLFVLLKAVAYWLDRYDLVITPNGGSFTGAGYTDVNAVIPGQDDPRRSSRSSARCCSSPTSSGAPGCCRRCGLGAAGARRASCIGVDLPGIVQQFQVKPDRADKEAPYIERNIEATRAAYDARRDRGQRVHRRTRRRRQRRSTEARDTLAERPAARPALLSPTFEQLQQVRGFYAFPTRSTSTATRSTARRATSSSRSASSTRRPARRASATGSTTTRLHPRLRRGRRLRQPAARRRRPSPTSPSPGPAAAGRLLDDRYAAADLLRRAGPDYSIVGAPEADEPRELDFPDGHGRRPANALHLHRQGRRPDRQLLQPAALRREVQRAEHPAVEPGQRRTRRSSTTATRASGSRRSRRG